MDGSLPGSSVHGILQARILEWVAVSLSRGTSRPRDQTQASCIGKWVLYHWATREALLLSQIDLNTQRGQRTNGQYMLNYSWDTNQICARPTCPPTCPLHPHSWWKGEQTESSLLEALESWALARRWEYQSFLMPPPLGMLPSYWHLSFATCSLKECWMIFHGIHGPHLLFHSSDDGHSDCFHVLAVVDGGILLSREKEENCAICRDVHGPKDSHTE